MPSTKPITTSLPTQQQSLTEARLRLSASLQAAIQTLTSEIASLSATGELSDRKIEKSFESLAFAVDNYREEQELAKIIGYDEDGAFAIAARPPKNTPPSLNAALVGVAQ